MKSRLVISHIQQLAKLVENHPSLKTIGPIGVLSSIFAKLKECGTCQGKQQETAIAYRNDFETALFALSETEAARFKSILGVERFGFYKRAPSGKFILHMIHDKSS